jgi:AraC-like DNA-binding protein
MVSDNLGLSWVTVPERGETETDREKRLQAVHVAGPFFLDDSTADVIMSELKSLGFSSMMISETSAFLKSLPVLPMTRMFEYAIMLYYCLTGERISVSDLHFRESRGNEDHTFADAEDKHGTYALEQEMVRMVREGDLNYKEHMNRIAMTGRIGTIANNDPLRQAKNAVITCITLFSRAAIEGGLPTETSLRLSDHYFQALEACKNIHEVSEIALTMQDDYVNRVHRIRTGSLSKQVAVCCEYINTHLEEELPLRLLAKRVSYSESYLSHKFKDEMGMKIREYIRIRRLERAKALLLSSQISVQDIATRFHFCSQSYFAEAFKTEYGITPSQYRANKPEKTV